MIILVNTVGTGRGSRPTVEHWCNAENNEAVIWRRGGPDGIKLKFDQARKFGRSNAGVEFIINSYEELDWETCETRILTEMQAEFPEIDFADADIVEHHKEKADPTASRSHRHVFARAFSEETGRPIRLSHPYPRVEKICRIIEHNLKFAFVKGPNLENIIPRLRAEKRADVADALRAAFPSNDKKVGGNSFSPAVRQQVKRLVKEYFKSVTAIASDPETARAALSEALAPHGIAIAVGPYVPPRFIITKDGQTIGKLAGMTGETIEAVESKLGDPANVDRKNVAAAEPGRRSEGAPVRPGGDDAGTEDAPGSDGGDRGTAAISNEGERKSRAAAFIAALRRHGEEVAKVAGDAKANATEAIVRLDRGVRKVEIAARRAIDAAANFKHPEIRTLKLCRRQLKLAKAEQSRLIQKAQKRQQVVKALEDAPAPSYFRPFEFWNHRKAIAAARKRVDFIEIKLGKASTAAKEASARVDVWVGNHDRAAAKLRAPLDEAANKAERDLRICDRARKLVKNDPLLLRFSAGGVYTLAEKAIDAADHAPVEVWDVSTDTSDLRPQSRKVQRL
jgi:hypothetical protein